jgi:hypothetical protein
MGPGGDPEAVFKYARCNPVHCKRAARPSSTMGRRQGGKAKPSSIEIRQRPDLNFKPHRKQCFR